MKIKLKRLLFFKLISLGIIFLSLNCEHEEHILIQEENTAEIIDFTQNPKIEHLSLNDIINDKTFTSLKEAFGILKEADQSIFSKNEVVSVKLVDTLGITIDANSIKKISYDNYVSFTMLMIEPKDTTDNVSNLIVQNYNGEERIFTVRYFNNTSKSKGVSSKTDGVSIGDTGIRSGLAPSELWNTPEEEGGNSSSSNPCTEYIRVCHSVTTWMPQPCPCKGHMPGDRCTCSVTPYYMPVTQEECENICILGQVETSTPNTSSTGGGDGSGAGSTSSTQIATIPITIAEESLAGVAVATLLGDLIGEDEQRCLTNTGNTAFAEEALNYLYSNENSQDAKVFVALASKSSCNGGTVDFDDNVILSKKFKDNAKLKCVYDKLAGDNSALFKDTVGAFIDNPNVNLILTIGDCQGAAGACTQDQYVEETGIITIKIKNINETPIEIAQMIIHEAIHAELAKYVLERDSTVDTNDKPRLFELYKFYRESGVPEKHIDHPYMALNYITPIASALRQFDNNKYPIDYYKSLAWIGLEDFDVNAVLTDPLINTYSQYLSTIIQNSTVCN